MKIKVWVYPDCSVSSASLPLEVFATANRVWAAQFGPAAAPPFEWKVQALNFTAATRPPGLRLKTDGPISVDPDDALVLLPAFMTESDHEAFWRSLYGARALFPLLREAHAQGVQIAAHCGASFLLANAGLLDGGVATGGRLEHMFRQHFPLVEHRIDQTTTEFMGLVCTSTAQAFAQFALGIVAQRMGAQAAIECAHALQLPLTDMPQLQVGALSSRPPQTHGDRLVLRAQEWIHQAHRRPFRLPELASHLRVSERTVIRRFKSALDTTPAHYALTLKVDVAKRLLAESAMTVDQISERVGYLETRSFRLLFKRSTGMSPVAYRRQAMARSGGEVVLENREAAAPAAPAAQWPAQPAG